LASGDGNEQSVTAAGIGQAVCPVNGSEQGFATVEPGRAAERLTSSVARHGGQVDADAAVPPTPLFSSTSARWAVQRVMVACVAQLGGVCCAHSMRWRR